MSIEQGEPNEASAEISEERKRITQIYRDNLARSLQDAGEGYKLSQNTIDNFFTPEINFISAQTPEDWDNLSQDEKRIWISNTATSYGRNAYDRIKSDQYRLSGNSFQPIAKQAGIEIATSNDQTSIDYIKKAGTTLLLLREMMANPNAEAAHNRYYILSRRPQLAMPTAHPHYKNEGFDSKFLDAVLAIDRTKPEVKKEGDSRTINLYSTAISGLRLIHQQDNMDDKAHTDEFAYFEYDPQKSATK